MQNRSGLCVFAELGPGEGKWKRSASSKTVATPLPIELSRNNMSPPRVAKQAAAQIRRKVMKQMATGVVVVSIPVGAWWYMAAQKRKAKLEEVRTRVRVPNIQDTDDFLIEKCQAGDVLVFDRRCEACAASPWAALSCLASRTFLCDETSTRSVSHGKFDHVGLVVPGYIKSRADAIDPANLMLLEATPSGIVARPLKQRLECSCSRSIMLLQLASPGERRVDVLDDDDFEPSQPVVRARRHVEKELRQFRDRWIELGEEKSYSYMHSTLGLGGALAYGMGMQHLLSGPVSPSAYLVLMGLQKAAAAQNINERENRQCKVEDFLRDHRFSEHDSIRLRPGWRYLSPIPLRETSKS